MGVPEAKVSPQKASTKESTKTLFICSLKYSISEQLTLITPLCEACGDAPSGCQKHGGEQ